MADSNSPSSSDSQPATSGGQPPTLAGLMKLPSHEHLVDQPMPGGTTMRNTVIDNKTYPMFSNKKRFDEIRDMEVRDTDVFLICYPKTGTHWMFSVVDRLLKLDLPELQLFDFDMPGKTVEMLDRSCPRLIAFHIEVERIPLALLKSKAKIVFTTRNPKDAAVSAWHHFSNMPPPMRFQGNWNDMFEWVFKDEAGMYGGQVPHMRGYLDTFGGQEERFRVVSFEDMKHRPRETMQGLATFLGANTDADHVNDVIEKTEFTNLKAERAAKKDFALFLYRKGEVGDWKNHFTVAQSEYVDQLMASQKGLEYEFLYS